MEEKDLKIPDNTSDRDEIISGIGMKEIAIIGIMLIVSIVVVIVFFLILGSLPIAFFIAFLVMATTIMFVMRDRIGENMIDKIKIFIHYIKMQKKYQYKHYDIYGELPDE